METTVLIIILFVELVVTGIFINLNTGQTDKGVSVYKTWDSKLDYASTYTNNLYKRYNGVEVEYADVVALVNESYLYDEYEVIGLPVNFQTNVVYRQKKYLCVVKTDERGLYKTYITFEEVRK